MTKSEVKICMLEKDYNKMLENPIIKNFIENYSPDDFHKKDGCIIFGWDAISWCPTMMEDQRALMIFLESNEDMPFKFIELPEYNEYEPIEEENYCKGECSKIYVTRKIEW